MNTKLYPLPRLAYYKLAVESCPPLLKGRNMRALCAEEITETCELLLATALRHQCSYWLLDGRSHQREQPQELHEWLREEYFPRVQAQLGRHSYIAFLVPPAVWAGLPAKEFGYPANWQAQAVHLRWFMEEADAVQWLNEQRSRQVYAPATGCNADPIWARRAGY